MTDEKPCDLDTLQTFEFDRVLLESNATGSVYLLGTLHGDKAIVHVQRTAIPSDAAPGLVKSGLESIDVFLENRPYFSANALLARGSLPDLALKVIWPATETHIRKYTTQPRRMVRETPEVYGSVVLPYIESFPPERLAWVGAILRGEKEADRVLHRSEGEDGFVITPDLKWDGVTIRALYLTAIVQTNTIRSLRDLTKAHVPLLTSIRDQAYISAARYGVEEGQLRMFVHYQPSYYHFHVHIVHVAHEVMAGMAVGQAHMLDDVINWLELSGAESLPARMTFTYALGVEHGLYAPLVEAGAAPALAKSAAGQDSAVQGEAEQDLANAPQDNAKDGKADAEAQADAEPKVKRARVE